MKKNKVLFVIPSLNSGGTVSSLASIVNSALSSMIDIDVFSIKRSGRNEAVSSYVIGLNGLINALHSDFSSLSRSNKVKFLLLKLLYRLSPFRSFIDDTVERWTINRIEKKGEYDYVVAFAEDFTTRFVSKFRCKNKIAWLHCDYAYSKAHNDFDYYNQYSTIVCVSNYTRVSFVNYYPQLADRTITIYNLFNSHEVLDKSKARIDDSLFDNSSFTLLSVGRIASVKRFEMIPQIASFLHKQGVIFKWYVIGDAREPEDLMKLKDAIQQNGMQDIVTYLGAKDNPYPYFVRSNVLVSLSISEACPMIFNEAKILHLPIVSTNFGSSYEFIEEGKNGFITSIDEMPAVLLKIATNKELLETMPKDEETKEDWNLNILSQLATMFS